ncbi:MAG: hypothetical protein AMXMBFR46_28930 [Acidimicrobiia bacterium]
MMVAEPSLVNDAGLVIGGPAPATATRTVQRLGGFAVAQCERHGVHTDRYLDVGCGNGSITRYIAGRFTSVDAIDMEAERLASFRADVQGDDRFRILEGDAADLPYDARTFDLVTSFEVLEHVVDVDATIAGIVRVARPGGLIVVSTPQVWFPLETHGMRWRGREIEKKVPLLPYLRPLHRKLALARLFSSRELDRRFAAHGCTTLATGYAAPQFERQASGSKGWEARVRDIRPLLDACERIPGLRCIAGVSLLKAFRAPC